MVGRGELTDQAWAQLAPLLPGNQHRHDRLVRWRRDGTGERLLAHPQTKSDAVGELEWVVSVDSSSVGAHQHAAGPASGPPQRPPKGVAHDPVEALGRSRGGLTTRSTWAATAAAGR